MNEEAKLKAKELIDKFTPHSIKLMIGNECIYNDAKQCALICCDEIWKELEAERVFEKYDFYQQVRNEILNYND
jgi:hypothetical protein